MEHRTSPTPTGADQQKNQANRLAVLVTGASGGIGRAISQAFGEIGWYVGVHYYQNESAAETTLGQVLKVGGTGSTYAADVREPESVRRMFDQFSRNTQGPIAVVCNAGIGQSELLVRHADHIWDNVLATNLTGTFNCIRAASKVMMKQRAGKIINITSVVAEMGNKGQANYCAAKAGVIGLTKAVARELASRNIQVNAIAPGFVETDMTATLPEAAKEAMLQAVPLGRVGTPEDVAGMAVFLASSEADYITGQTLNVDGGMVMA
ncbi:3-oxoacyl-ACP reductase FabG [candidate division KSB1 bacterium]|nr:3-oxoacyl-ACP reductase FabG [candidate division KSB1 bacterium]